MEVPGVADLNRRFSLAEFLVQEEEKPPGIGDLHVLNPADADEKPDVDLPCLDFLDDLGGENLGEGGAPDPGGTDPDPLFRCFKGVSQWDKIFLVGQELHGRLLSTG